MKSKSEITDAKLTDLELQESNVDMKFRQSSVTSLKNEVRKSWDILVENPQPPEKIPHPISVKNPKESSIPKIDVSASIIKCVENNEPSRDFLPLPNDFSKFSKSPSFTKISKSNLSNLDIPVSINNRKLLASISSKFSNVNLMVNGDCGRDNESVGEILQSEQDAAGVIEVQEVSGEVGNLDNEVIMEKQTCEERGVFLNKSDLGDFENEEMINKKGIVDDVNIEKFGVKNDTEKESSDKEVNETPNLATDIKIKTRSALSHDFAKSSKTPLHLDLKRNISQNELSSENDISSNKDFSDSAREPSQPHFDKNQNTRHIQIQVETRKPEINTVNGTGFPGNEKVEADDTSEDETESESESAEIAESFLDDESAEEEESDEEEVEEEEENDEESDEETTQPQPTITHTKQPMQPEQRYILPSHTYTPYQVPRPPTFIPSNTIPQQQLPFNQYYQPQLHQQRIPVNSNFPATQFTPSGSIPYSGFSYNNINTNMSNVTAMHPHFVHSQHMNPYEHGLVNSNNQIDSNSSNLRYGSSFDANNKQSQQTQKALAFNFLQEHHVTRNLYFEVVKPVQQDPVPTEKLVQVLKETIQKEFEGRFKKVSFAKNFIFEARRVGTGSADKVYANSNTQEDKTEHVDNSSESDEVDIEDKNLHENDSDANPTDFFQNKSADLENEIQSPELIESETQNQPAVMGIQVTSKSDLSHFDSPETKEEIDYGEDFEEEFEAENNRVEKVYSSEFDESVDLAVMVAENSPTDDIKSNSTANIKSSHLNLLESNNSDEKHDSFDPFAGVTIKSLPKIPDSKKIDDRPAWRPASVNGGVQKIISIKEKKPKSRELVKGIFKPPKQKPQDPFQIPHPTQQYPPPKSSLPTARAIYGSTQPSTKSRNLSSSQSLSPPKRRTRKPKKVTNKPRGKSRAISTVGRKGATFGTQAAAVRIANEAQDALMRSLPRKKTRGAGRSRALDEDFSKERKSSFLGHGGVEIERKIQYAMETRNVDKELRLRLEQIQQITLRNNGRTDTLDHVKSLFQLSKFWFQQENTKEAILTASRAKDFLTAIIQQLPISKMRNFENGDSDAPLVLRLESEIDKWIDKVLRSRF
ncbi:hypothetical protein HK098_002777 [Nowakowskiella sp. JEL0407]|nr:hypothetical protein HK098_002777 [Nowakowskiella sp. JEL0407]